MGVWSGSIVMETAEVQMEGKQKVIMEACEEIMFLCTLRASGLFVNSVAGNVKKVVLL